jgi:hypothetical protein
MNGFDERINKLKNGDITARWAARKILKLQAEIDEINKFNSENIDRMCNEFKVIIAFEYLGLSILPPNKDK